LTMGKLEEKKKKRRIHLVIWAKSLKLQGGPLSGKLGGNQKEAANDPH